MILAAIALTVPLLVGGTGPGTPPLPTLSQSAEVELRVERDGTLSVAEAVAVPADREMTRVLRLREPAGGHRDRLSGIRDISIEGAGEAELTDETLTVRLRPGTSIVRYTVDGAVSRGAGGPRLNWDVASGWDAELKFVRASLAAPKIPSGIRCDAAGGPCLAAQTDHAGLTRVNHRNLPAGAALTVGVDLPDGSVPVTERLVPEDSLAGAFLATPPVVAAWAGLGVLLLAGAAFLVWYRRQSGAGPRSAAGTGWRAGHRQGRRGRRRPDRG
ncbi:DUF2207 domain-containing protein [Amycolatopsis suaedae]|uniref:DUF2207 domain-containing protein n=1 Tax=Amycolatopsis suaedae TaxID=2510978 RepID=A0A4Q7J6T2_9PSEU|nr:DUF2207 domain-containing protein [Amycolatopsis suaedae]RZQ62608.1 DUF2207 domain-containing protein [Amycolatopsis suaedae]